MVRAVRVGRRAVAGMVVLLAVAACSRSATPSQDGATPGGGTQAASHGFASTTFAVPFEVDVPTWLPNRPSAEELNFLTWTGEDEWIDRAVRVLAPVNVYAPGAAVTSALPTDYLSYLRAQTTFGARFVDESSITIGGRPATVMTATTSASLDGSLGCQAKGIGAHDCFGLQPYFALRIAVVDVDGRTLLLWARAVEGAPDSSEQFADFEQMLSTLRFV